MIQIMMYTDYKIVVYLGMLCRESGIYVRCSLQRGMPSRKSKFSAGFFFCMSLQHLCASYINFLRTAIINMNLLCQSPYC